ncbi:hypothetical protein GMORB2_1974 [Geosmithia morbida]|uniref:MI domain-containing protein n=1 Tax=Geosmithia morbida TaxID=1094350 RepID=A0A9P4YR44_9HYPO|nr:uncharacterized protein GMORB2_1974 [Geosmithia morbida]KAF4121566.1 hypothetical protein GMORB2_1974 [Geosmithia morbida]
MQDRIFKSLGIETPGQRQQQRGRSKSNHPGARVPQTRKDQRKAQREQKKASAYSRNGNKPHHSSKPSVTATPKSAPKKSAFTASNVPSNLEGSEDDDLEGPGLEEEDDSKEADSFDGSDDEIDLEESDQGEETLAHKSKISSAAQAKLDQDDAEIEELERKLGIKKGRKSLPKSFKEDGLDLLLGDLDGPGGDDESEDDEKDSSKRKRDYDDWLSAKRRKTELKPYLAKKGTDEVSELEDDDGLSLNDEGDFDDGESYDGLDDTNAEQPTRQRENPYVAPTTGPVVAKYVPPSLRKQMGGQREATERLRKQSQGLINRLTDANILSIVQGAEEIYQKNARGDVTEMLTDVILAQVCKPEALPDQFFVLMGGFAAAVYKIIGSSFGSHLIRRVVNDFGQEYEKASAVQTDESAIPKEPSNLLTFLSQLYVFEVIRCKILFDYMERLLEDLTELNVELLLRICRNGGRLLRRDDPQALKHISGALNKAVSKKGHDNVSVRTKFIVETIDQLKNKKAKGKGMDSAMVSEHVVRMKKHLGELKSQTRRLDGLTPMGVDLEDIIKADTRGKWWLVGASVPVKNQRPKVDGGDTDEDADRSDANGTDVASDTESEDLDFLLPDYPKKAREQGLGTPSQIAIFTAIMMAPDADTGYRQYLNLKLRRDDRLEIARVLVQCVGSEAEYNPYYAAVAMRVCDNNNKVRFAFQSRLWQIFKAMGESLFDEDSDDQDTADAIRFRDETRVCKVARFYADLIAQGSLRISVLKPLNLTEIEPHTHIFLESLLVGLLQECKSKKPEREDSRVEKAFGGAREFTQLSAGLDWFMRERLQKTKALSSTKLKKLDGVKRKARVAIQGVDEE